MAASQSTFRHLDVVCMAWPHTGCYMFSECDMYMMRVYVSVYPYACSGSMCLLLVCGFMLETIIESDHSFADLSLQTSRVCVCARDNGL